MKLLAYHLQITPPQRAMKISSDGYVICSTVTDSVADIYWNQTLLKDLNIFLRVTCPPNLGCAGLNIENI